MYTRRQSLSEHPCFQPDYMGDESSQSDFNRVALGEITNHNRIPMKQHPYLVKKTYNEKNPLDEIEIYKYRDNFVEITNKRRKSLPEKENNVMDALGFQFTPLVSNAGVFDVGCSQILNPPHMDCAQKKVKYTQNSDLDGLSRSLFSDDSLSDHPAEDTDYSDIEYSKILGFDDIPDPLFSDDDEFIPEDLPDDPDENISHKYKVPAEYATLGPPTKKCEYCNAVMWNEERVNKNSKKGIPKFSLCCRKGLVNLPAAPKTPSYLWQIYNDPKEGSNFQKCSRIYNSMFCFTSTGGTVDNSINNGGGPFIYKLNGQNHHVFGSLIPDDGEDPKFCQLYIYDTENEVSNRMQWIDVKEGDKIKDYIVQGLMKMFDESNELVKTFRIARDRFKDCHIVEMKIILKVCRSQSGRENQIGTSDEVAAVMVGDLEDPCESRDIIIQRKAGGFQRITNIHPKLMALQYPLLFPNGEDGFHIDLKYTNVDEEKQRKRDSPSMKDFYSYKFQVRLSEGMTPRLSGRLFQQYVVDAYSAIEQSRLWWFKTHQTTLRNELYSHICDHLRNGDSDADKIGKSFILPAGFVGSKRYMQQNFQDALAVCRHVGHPDLFLTMTCNTVWDEIMHMINLIPGGTPQNNPDIISRVFKLKLDQLLDDVQKKSFFGVCIGVMYVVEFQKRGLPHVHMLIWLDNASKKHLKANVDKFVSAEIPDPIADPVGYEAVKTFMMHGPCGVDFPKCPCMKDKKCSKHFPKKFLEVLLSLMCNELCVHV